MLVSFQICRASMDLTPFASRMVSIIFLSVGSILFMLIGCTKKKTTTRGGTSAKKRNSKTTRATPISKISQISKMSECEELKSHERSASGEKEKEMATAVSMKDEKPKAKKSTPREQKKSSDESKERSKDESKDSLSKETTFTPMKRSKELCAPMDPSCPSGQVPVQRKQPQMNPPKAHAVTPIEANSMVVYTARCPPPPSAEVSSLVNTANTSPATFTAKAKSVQKGGSAEVAGHDGGYEKLGDMSMDELKKIADGIP